LLLKDDFLNTGYRSFIGLQQLIITCSGVAGYGFLIINPSFSNCLFIKILFFRKGYSHHKNDIINLCPAKISAILPCNYDLNHKLFTKIVLLKNEKYSEKGDDTFSFPIDIFFCS